MAKRKLPPQGAQQQVQVDLSKAETLKCDDCGASFEFVKSAKEGTLLFKDDA